jgi:hypothetical protein
LHRSGPVAAALGTTKAHVCLGFLLIVLAATFGFKAGLARADGGGIYFQGTWAANGGTHPTDYDDTCNVLIYWYYGEFDKSSADNGRVMFIDSGGTWHHPVSGLGSIATSEPNYASYQKKVSTLNYTNIAYPGTAIAAYHSFRCT